LIQRALGRQSRVQAGDTYHHGRAEHSSQSTSMFATVEYASTTSSTVLPDFAPHARRRRDAKPKGLWRARLDSHVQTDRQLSASPSNHHDHGSTSHCSPKRPRLITYQSDSSDDDSFLFASTRHQTPSPPTPPPERESRWDTLSRLMDTTTTAYRGTHTNLRSTCDFDDWEDLKELFTKAAEQYECTLIYLLFR